MSISFLADISPVPPGEQAHSMIINIAEAAIKVVIVLVFMAFPECADNGGWFNNIRQCTGWFSNKHYSSYPLADPVQIMLIRTS